MNSSTNIELPAPMFELRGKAAKIDLSAWISAVVMFAGLSIIGPAAIVTDALSGGYGLLSIVGSYLAFLVVVLIIQQHMRISLAANTFGTAQSLVTSGIFQFSRNPIYVAYLIPLASFAYFSIPASIACISLYILVMNLTVIRKEERELQRSFGASFAAYCKVTPRWIV